MTHEVFLQHLDIGLKHLQLSLTNSQKSQIWTYQQLLTKWNKTINLTAHRDELQSLEKNFLDSLALVSLLNEKTEKKNLMDVGSGAGFPGVVIKIICPFLEITLVESDQRKSAFLAMIIRELKLDEMVLFNQRLTPKTAQSDTKTLSDRFDVIVSRATMEIEELQFLTQPYLKEGGRILAMVSEKTSIPPLWNEIKRYFLPFSKIPRRIVEFQES